MKKKLFVSLCVCFSLITLITVIKVKASSGALTPWTLSFDDKVVNIHENEPGFSTNSNQITIRYNDTSGQTSGGYFDLWLEDIGVVPYYPYIEHEYIQNGQSRTYECGGNVWFHYYFMENGMETKTEISFFMDRDLENRLRTNFINGKIYYEYVYYFDHDFVREYDFDLTFNLTNLVTKEQTSQYGHLEVHTVGDYSVLVKNARTNQQLTYFFKIRKNNISLTLYEKSWQSETILSNDNITSNGVRLCVNSDAEIDKIIYHYTPIGGVTETGMVNNNYIFYRKGFYEVDVINIYGFTKTCSFIIQDFDLITDPSSSVTVGTEVSANQGIYNGRSIKVGFTRCIYLGNNASSQSRFDYIFTSSNNEIATISSYGTVVAKQKGFVTITCREISNPNKFAVIKLEIY